MFLKSFTDQQKGPGLSGHGTFVRVEGIGFVAVVAHNLESLKTVYDKLTDGKPGFRNSRCRPVHIFRDGDNHWPLTDWFEREGQYLYRREQDSGAFEIIRIAAGESA